MFLTIREINPADVRHLHCTDPALAEEIVATNRSIHRLDEQVGTWLYLDPQVSGNGKEVAPCQL